MHVNQLTVVCFPSVPSNGVAGLEPPPPPAPPPPPSRGRVSKHQQACPCVRCVSGSEPKGGGCCERAGRRRSAWTENREESDESGEGCLSEMSVGVPLKEHCLADNTPGCAGIIRAAFTVGGALSQTS